MEGEVLSYQVGFFSDQNLNAEGLVIADLETGETFEVQRSLSFDDQDRQLHLDTYCLIFQGRSHYGGLVSWRALDDASLALTLTTGAAQTLGLPEEFVIPTLTSEDWSTIHSHLPLLLV